MLQKAVGEASGRSAQIEAGPSRGINPEGFESTLQFQASTTHISRPLKNNKLFLGPNESRWLGDAFRPTHNLPGHDQAFGLLTGVT
tara:strand:+ start:276 stop:533 length:258 start_codon:yes stop_codon:yes gene_type:complete